MTKQCIEISMTLAKKSMSEKEGLGYSEAEDSKGEIKIHKQLKVRKMVKIRHPIGLKEIEKDQNISSESSKTRFFSDRG